MHLLSLLICFLGTRRLAMLYVILRMAGLVQKSSVTSHAAAAEMLTYALFKSTYKQES